MSFIYECKKIKAIMAPKGSAREAKNDAPIPFLIDPVD